VRDTGSFYPERDSLPRVTTADFGSDDCGLQ
jgi:hypothetical protein